MVENRGSTSNREPNPGTFPCKVLEWLDSEEFERYAVSVARTAATAGAQIEGSSHEVHSLADVDVAQAENILEVRLVRRSITSAFDSYSILLIRTPTPGNPHLRLPFPEPNLTPVLVLTEGVLEGGH